MAANKNEKQEENVELKEDQTQSNAKTPTEEKGRDQSKGGKKRKTRLLQKTPGISQPIPGKIAKIVKKVVAPHSEDDSELKAAPGQTAGLSSASKPTQGSSKEAAAVVENKGAAAANAVSSSSAPVQEAKSQGENSAAKAPVSQTSAEKADAKSLDKSKERPAEKLVAKAAEQAVAQESQRVKADDQVSSKAENKTTGQAGEKASEAQVMAKTPVPVDKKTASQETASPALRSQEGKQESEEASHLNSPSASQEQKRSSSAPLGSAPSAFSSAASPSSAAGAGTPVRTDEGSRSGVENRRASSEENADKRGFAKDRSARSSHRSDRSGSRKREGEEKRFAPKSVPQGVLDSSTDSKKKEEVSKAAAPGPRVLVDEGITVASSAKFNVIRPQEGSYLGSDADKPNFVKRGDYKPYPGRGSRPSSRFSKPGSRFSQGDRPSSLGFGRKPEFQKDEDEDQKPKFRRKTRTKGPSDMPEVEFAKSAASRKRSDRFSKNRDRDKSRYRDFTSEEAELAFDIMNRDRKKQRERARTKAKPKKEETLVIFDGITVKELAKAMDRPATDVIKTLLGLGASATMNQSLDFDTCAIVAEELGYKVEKDQSDDVENLIDIQDEEKDLVSRPPIVAVMGHVDHGKTSLLDYIRDAQVTEQEPGGITQALGAYTAKIGDKMITFIDTPGHEAFSTMRARGAQVTDLAILIIAADDGVKPQTLEALAHIKAAGTRFMVVINKIDRLQDKEKLSQAVERIKADLSQASPEDDFYGGGITMVEVSAKTGQNMDELLSMILLEAEVMELKANPNRPGVGTILESSLDKSRGPVASVLVSNGTFARRDFVAAGQSYGRIRSLTSDRGKRLKEVTPSMPVELIGLTLLPEAGDVIYVMESLDKAKEYATKYAERNRTACRLAELNESNALTLDHLAADLEKMDKKELKIILKGDVQGSVEALTKDLKDLSTDEIEVKIIYSAVGGINESDVTLARSSNAYIVGFNVAANADVRKTAQSLGVALNIYDVIYNATDAVQQAILGLASPTYQEVRYGSAQVREIYKSSSVGVIAGCYVDDGKILRNAKVRLIRGGKVIYTGVLGGLKRFQDDAKEVAKGYECGINIQNYNDIKVEDVIECFGEEEVKQGEEPSRK